MDAKLNFAAIILMGFSCLARAQETGIDAALDDAERFVRERESVKLQAHSVVSPQSFQAALLQNRFYKPGDAWVVAVTYFEHAQVMKSAVPGESRTFESKPRYLSFKVESVDATAGRARVLVADCDAEGKALAGAKSRELTLTIFGKEGHHQALATLLPAADPDSDSDSGAAGSAGGFDGFPFRMPPLKSAQMRAQGASVSFNTYDYLSRKISVQWKSGDLWPHTVEGAVGRAVLLKQEKAQ